MPRTRSLGSCFSFLLLAALVGGCAGSTTAPTAATSASAGALPSNPPPTPTPTPSLSPSGPPDPTPRTVRVDGREVAIDCRGEGQPTVILESGLGVPMGTWSAVMTEVARTARVCRYDRPTFDSDDPKDFPHTADRMVGQLRALLAAAGEGAPYILVGHAFGGLNVQYFARTFPDEVLGVVFVDAIHPDLDGRIEQILSPAQAATRREALELNPEGITFADIVKSAQLVRDAPGFPPVSTIAIRHGLPPESNDPAWPADQVETLWAELADDLATLGDPPQPVVLAGKSRDRIQEDEPGLVIDAIDYCLEGVR